MTQKSGSILIVGAGIGGIRSALDLADIGFQVTLIDQADQVGGLLSQIDRQFPTDACGMCRMLPIAAQGDENDQCLRKGLMHPRIDILPSTELMGLDGGPGDYTAHLRQRAPWIDASLCIGCGACESQCTVEVPDAFNNGLSLRKAVYRPVPQAFADTYVIDEAACTQCGACKTVCPTNAVRLPADWRKDFAVLVVDDELVVRDSLKEWLVNEGFGNVATAESGPEALAQLAAAPCRVMLTDIKMPGMDGVTLMQRAKDIHPDLAVVMMTAYATVETAVEAMKIGALDYLMKPFDPEAVIALMDKVHEGVAASGERSLEAGAVIVSCGNAYADPSLGKNPYAYGVNPHVVTSLTFERILSVTGPTRGKPVRPADGKPLGNVAWLQCVGSRDLQQDADFCSGICCMMSVKEAVWAREKTGGRMRTTVFHMDMRTPGKGWQAYKERAEQVHGVRFERARVHSIDTVPGSDDPVLRYVSLDGKVKAETVDLVVLAVGQRPAVAAARLAEVTEIPLDDRGFFKADPLLPARTEREGVFLGGTAGGFRPISGSVIQASAAALEAARTVHRAGGRLAAAPEPGEAPQSLRREPWRIRVAVCTCGRHDLSDGFRADEFRDKISRAFQQDPAVADLFFVERACLESGLEEIKARADAANGFVVGACRHHQWKQNRSHVAAAADLPTSLIEWVDLYPAGTGASEPSANSMVSALKMGLAHLKHSSEDTGAAVAVSPKALVVGGGIAGMQAALGIADLGYHVDLVERDDDLGGNLRWIHHTLGGQEVAPFLDNIRSRVKEHPHIDIHLNASIRSAGGIVGDFISMVETRDDDLVPIRHGVVVLATGGREAAAKAYGWGTHEGIITQKQFEQQYKDQRFSPEALNSVVMIQCVGSREAQRPYCSRVCCATALKHALTLKRHNPDIRIWILYRDLMADGFNETYYTRARQAGVIFIPYETTRKPVVNASEDKGLRVEVVDPVLESTLQIETDLLVLATGVTSELPGDLVAAYGAEADSDGFFKEADAKWRPVQALSDGVLACGLSQAPVTIAESVAGGQAAAMAALRVLTRSELKAGKPTASVIHRLCSLCEQCLAFCPYGARRIDDESGRLEVHPGLCQGCGACTVACPSGAATLNGQSAAQLLSVIHGALG